MKNDLKNSRSLASWLIEKAIGEPFGNPRVEDGLHHHPSQQIAHVVVSGIAYARADFVAEVFFLTGETGDEWTHGWVTWTKGFDGFTTFEIRGEKVSWGKICGPGDHS